MSVGGGLSGVGGSEGAVLKQPGLEVEVVVDLVSAG